MKLQPYLRYVPSLFAHKIEGREKEKELASELPVYQLEEQDYMPRPLHHISAELGKHWAIVGKTGAGKTRFALALLEFLRRANPKVPRYVLNSTADDMPEIHAPLEVTGDSPPALLRDGMYTQVWVPDTDNLNAYNQWMLNILQSRRPAIVLIDEVASLTGNSKHVTVLEGHMKLLKQGRKHNITVINETQELTRVPMMMFRQMEYYAQFRIGKDPHELAMARCYLDISKQEQRQPSAPYGFFLKRDGLHSVQEYRSMNELFKGGYHVG